MTVYVFTAIFFLFHLLAVPILGYLSVLYFKSKPPGSQTILDYLNVDLSVNFFSIPSYVAFLSLIKCLHPDPIQEIISLVLAWTLNSLVFSYLTLLIIMGIVRYVYIYHCHLFDESLPADEKLRLFCRILCFSLAIGSTAIQVYNRHNHR